jgi:tetratricopeptide (TPR) repeat protein
MRNVLDVEPPLPSASEMIAPAVRRELQGDLDNIVRKAMEKDPARRYSSAERLSADLGRWLEKRPIEARPRTWSYRAERFVKRNRLGVALAAALLLTLLGAVAAIAWQVRHEQETARYNARLTEFLTRVMGLRYDGESSPMRAHGRATRMVDVIRYAGDRLNSEMADQPRLQGRLDADMGHALAELGYFADAERSLQRGLHMTDPKNDPALAGELLGYLARNHFLEGQILATEKDFDEALRLIRLSGPAAPKGVEQLLLLNLEPVRELTKGETPEAESMIERAVELGRQMGEQTPAYAISLQARVSLRLGQGRVADAESDAMRALKIQEAMAVVPLEHAQSLGELAVVRAMQGKRDEALQLVDRALVIIESTLGRGSLNFQLLRISHAELIALKGDLKKAVKEFAEVDAETARELPKAKWIRARALSSLGSGLLKMGRKDEGRSTLEKGLELAREDPGPQSPLAARLTAQLKKVKQ